MYPATTTTHKQTMKFPVYSEELRFLHPYSVKYTTRAMEMVCAALRLAGSQKKTVFSGELDC